jgi:kynureninase
MIMIQREHLSALDANDPLAHCRARFDLPDDLIYLDGNSLGALVKSVAPRMARAVQTEWARGLIRSWNDAGWYPAPLRVGDRIAQLIGAESGEVAVCDSISVNLFKVLVSALRMRPGRPIILSEEGNFPTDRYIASGVAELMQAELICVAPDAMIDTIAQLGERVAVLTLTHVNYKTGRVYDMAAITAAAHRTGALVNWDLAHSAGTLPVALNACRADFAVGCGYKYLNGGPGSPAFVFAASRHHSNVQQPITGWHGHARPFEFSEHYEPHAGIDRMLVGTAPQLSLIALEEALTAFDGVDLQVLRRKGSALGDLFIQLLEQELPDAGFTLACPRLTEQRGSQVSFHHPNGYAIMQALIARGVIGDFRAPDILRFGFAGLYVRYIDIWNAVAALRQVMDTRAWDTPEFTTRKAVT